MNNPFTTNLQQQQVQVFRKARDPINNFSGVVIRGRNEKKKKATPVKSHLLVY